MSAAYGSLWPRLQPLIHERQPDGYRPPESDGWLTYHSPLRDDDENPSFSVRPDGPSSAGGFVDHATGQRGSLAELARLLGVDPQTASNGHRANGAGPTPEQFSHDRCLDLARLGAVFGVRGVSWFGRPALRYPTPCGIDQLKFLDGQKPKYKGARKGGRVHWYGVRQAWPLGGDTLYLVNGPPSVWASTQAGVPAICLIGGEGSVPAPELVAELRGALGASTFACVRVVYDRGEKHDQEGHGSRAVAAALRKGGIDADAYELPDAVGAGGDVDDLHQLVGDAGLGSALQALPKLERGAESAAHGDEQGEDDQEKLISRQGCSIEREEITSLWDGFIPYAKLTVFLGLPDVGKSFMGLHLMATLTAGRTLPRAESPLVPADCLIATTEDDYGDTIAPRLDWLGSDDKKWWTMEGIARDEDLRPLYLDRDLARIERKIKEHDAKLVVFDPFSAFLDQTNPARDTEVRRVVGPLAQIAKRTGAAIVVITHIKKGTEEASLYKALNSVALVGQARSALAFATDPEDDARRVIVPVKGNLSGRAEPIGFKIVPIEGTKKARVVFDDAPVSLTWQTVFSAAGGEADADRASALKEAKEYLLHALGKGRQLVQEVQADAKENGIKEHTLRRAREALGVQTLREEEFGGKCYWELPAVGQNADEDPEGDEQF